MKKTKKERNCAFIDAQNLHMSIEAMGWRLDYKLFRTYLQEHYNVKKAYMFMGFKPDEQHMYEALSEYGYDLVFKPAITLKNGTTKGNCDADLVLQAMIDYKKYDKAIIVSGDGDFHCLIQFLKERGKLDTVLVPSIDTCSGLIKNLVDEKLESVSDLKKELAYIKVARAVKKAPAKAPVKRHFTTGFVVRKLASV
ncbi:MAG: NYN domain-containing protein [Candidatus Peregrinibacteria bacterium]|nr:NYN domain-containing protein [Candidatus Peregrinibacteria bacterium]MDZ4245383.1 NYN domain-containing protein [Candidatus Gracilibacteria bacterium]